MHKGVVSVTARRIGRRVSGDGGIAGELEMHEAVEKREGEDDDWLGEV